MGDALVLQNISLEAISAIALPAIFAWLYRLDRQIQALSHRVGALEQALGEAVTLLTRMVRAQGEQVEALEMRMEMAERQS